MIHLVHTWHMIEKSARDADFYAYLHHFCCKSARVCIKCASSLHFTERGVFPRQTPRSDADYVQNTCRLCRLGADFGRLFADFFQKSLRLADYADFGKVCTTAKIWHADFMHTFSLGFKVCIKSPTCSSKPDRNPTIKHNATTHSAYLLRPGRAPAPPPPPPPCWP